jgi:hypothetical protein
MDRLATVKDMEQPSEEKGQGRVQVNTGDTEELIRLSEALDKLSTKIDRISGIVIRLYQLTERLELSVKNSSATHERAEVLDDDVMEWIRGVVAKKRRKALKKLRKKNKKKGKHKR